MNCSDVWILAEQEDGKILRISHELITRGIALSQKRGCKLCAMVFGNNIDEADLQDLVDRGVDKVVSVEAPELQHFLIEPYSACMHDILSKYKPEIILGGATSTGRTLLPYVAMTAYTGLTADCTGLDIEEGTNNLLQTRPAIGGNIMATIKTPDFRPQMSTVRPRSTKPAPILQKGRKGEIIRLKHNQKLLNSRILKTGFIPNEEEQSLHDAEIVVVAGRGIKKAENVQLIRDLANALGGTLAATRDVVDRGWLSYSHQVGLSGKTISPKLYVGVGVSGAIQHLAGMQTSETIVAINNDPEAQIFKVADFGIVGDLFEIVPALTKMIKEGKLSFVK
ncbi:MAG TPA: electron transfer flavoprotein subunit alpha [Lentisphaeria bacterium]|nr:MAG: electron transfer flavoprotein subunit alpha [Lentisphaerae bacterium GWF2_50_93]HCE46254.1 electron transfer flavoprotein subunit alpha [Lentisphaeria bacterium]